ncbi:taste receptor type 2 member 1-like [Ctenodactylus gundi]
MPEVHPIVHFLWAVAQFLTGVFANSIIVVANATELKKQRKVAPLDLLLSCLATSRICLQLVIFYIHLVILSLVKQLIRVENFLIFLFVNDSGLWLATWLGVFYCAKIATFPHLLFLWLKRRIGKLVPWLILESVLGAAVSTGVQGSCALIFSEEFVGKFFFRNATEIQGVYIMPLALFITGVLLPLILFLASALLLIVSLGRHTQQMGAPGAPPACPRCPIALFPHEDFET